ncbi:MAG: amidohydrolase [Burkholderiaceae bacterium]|jgi:predicted amidohydrolase YtcJ|nr:amidohydrolase [Burkholderiales bacterium]MCZ8338328.1 amidohydrolase [Burkholderiaceae bacterium]
MTVYVARRVITMDDSLPEATAVGVVGDRIAAVGDLASIEPWRAHYDVTVDERFAKHVLMPGFVDNHIHPFLGAMLMPMEIIAPEPWQRPDGTAWPAARTPQEYRRLLDARLAARPDPSEWFISFGYQPSLHGRLFRRELDALYPDRPVILWQRSYHETYMNSRAIEKLALAPGAAESHPQVDLPNGHFFETGNKLVLSRLMPHFLREAWYHRGLADTATLMQRAGITTAGDQLFGGIDPAFELAALDAVLERPGRPLRVVNVFDARGFANRASGRPFGPPDQPIDFAAGQPAMERLAASPTRHVRYARAVKLFADGAMFSQLMQMRPPGYIDGHHGAWLMSPEVLEAGVRHWWTQGWQIHVHVNGDAGMDAVLSALERAQAERPRFDHRFHVHHVGVCTAAQVDRLAALGAHASVNPYYVHALADDYSLLGLGPERASQITRCASMLRAGMRVSFHSDFMMAPPEPLLLAWCAANRITASGAVAGPAERLTLDQALRGITIDAAWGLGMEAEIGSIAAGKLADFAVLADDPFELGVERLKDVRVAGTVFEGVPHLLAQPAASLHAADGIAHAIRAAARSVRGASARDPARRAAPRRIRPIPQSCCGNARDRCDVIRQWSAWLGEASAAARAAAAAPRHPPAEDTR